MRCYARAGELQASSRARCWSGWRDLLSIVAGATSSPERHVFLQNVDCVKKHLYRNPNTGVREPAKDGLCSTYICNVRAGDTVAVSAREIILFLGSWSEASLPYMAEWRALKAKNGEYGVDIQLRLVATRRGQEENLRTECLVSFGSRFAGSEPAFGHIRFVLTASPSRAKLELSRTRYTAIVYNGREYSHGYCTTSSATTTLLLLLALMLLLLLLLPFLVLQLRALLYGNWQHHCHY
ncbi:unnamed protein product [Rangifer tarandus platyrhynchus]|uniref:Uncharacterized protein n=1 Tax=Rangifer tarandus platyrhynchus TaxID=3082113 RepID=A0ABN8XMH6_RANTA|nr:unnamed protein product [Rangifer tarandus platyrhynchus]